MLIKVIFGLMVGMLQLFFVSRIVKAFIAEKPMELMMFLLGKLIVWGIFFAGVVIFFKDGILLCGSAAAAGLVLGSFALFAWKIYKQ